MRNINVLVLLILLAAAGMTYVGDLYISQTVLCDGEWCTRVDEGED